VALNRARVADPIGVTVDLQYVVSIEYFDSADSATVLWKESLIVPLGATTAQLQAQVVARGKDIRDAFAAQAAARIAVPQGTTVTVP
jgi:hypothetical protein